MTKRLRSERGAALIETAVTIPMLLLVAVAIFEFGRAYQTWQVLTNAAREGARVSVLPTATVDDVKATVVNYMQGGALPNATADMVTVNRNAAVNGKTASQIGIDFPFEFMVLGPVASLVKSGTLGEPLTMHATALMRNEAQ
jgi:Flp pilus assembly protein TadG